jgi:hypothetical protein
MKYSVPPKLGTVDDLTKRFEAAKSVRARWDTVLMDCYKYAAPKRDTLSGQGKGQRRDPEIVDSTAELGVEQFATRLQAMLVPPWMQWVKLVPGSDIPDQLKGRAQDYLDQVSKKLFDHLNHSNFASQAHEAFTDLAVSTGAITLERSDGPTSLLGFNAVPLAELVPEEGPRGTLETIWRQHEVVARNIKRLWPDADLSEKCKSLLADKPDTRVQIVEGTIYEPEAGLYYQCCMEKEAKHLIYMREYKVSPWIVFRESVRPGEVLGRGRVMSVLADIKMLNAVQKWGIKSLALQTAGVYTAADDGVINPFSVKIEPGSIIAVGSNDSQNPTLRPLPMAGNPQLQQYGVEELKKSINRVLFAEPFGDMDAPVRTATEISMRNQEMMQQSGSAFARLQTEFIEKIVRRSIDILMEEGEIQPLEINGKLVTIKHTSPLAKVQDQEDLTSVRVLLEAAMAFGNHELMAATLKMENLLPWMATKLGVDSALVRSEEEIQQVAQATAERNTRREDAEVAQMEPDIAPQQVEVM